MVAEVEQVVKVGGIQAEVDQEVELQYSAGIKHLTRTMEARERHTSQKERRWSMRADGKIAASHGVIVMQT